MFKNLKKKYDKKSISTIENMVDIFDSVQAQAQSDRILTLYYLQRTKRFKENKFYKNESFKSYLFDRHGMRMGTYDNSRLAIFKNMPEVKKHGIGLVRKVYSHCGMVNSATVFTKLNSPKIKTRSDKEAVIQKYAKSKKTKPVGLTKTQLHNIIINKNIIIAEQQTTINKLNERIHKLVITVKSYKKREVELLEV